MLLTLKNKYNLTLFIAVVWQLISIGLIATGVWSKDLIWLNTGLLVILFVILPSIDALGLFLVSLPFMVVLPNNLPMWRILLVWLFTIAIIKFLFTNKVYSFSNLVFNLKDFWRNKLQTWDKWLYGLLVLGALSLFVARFPVHGFKQIVFLINIYLLYLVSLLVVNSEKTYKAFFHYVKLSLLITVLLGFTQYILSLFFTPYYFWQYWATLISTSYYGQALGDVLVYSNSWFSANGGGQSLRMFGILQDTHAFSVVVIFALALWISRANVGKAAVSIKDLIKSQNWQFWLGLTALCFAIIASGTRGVWLAMFAPVAVSIFLMVWYRAKLLALLPLVSYFLVVVLFILSPFISMGLNLIRSVNSNDNFLNRANSIYDLNESSNVGRLEIWKSSLNYAIHNPLGTGYGNFIASITPKPSNDNSVSYDQVANQKNLRFNLPQKFITAHSLYLHILVELGLLGLLLFGLTWLSLFKKIWVTVKKENFKVSPQSELLINIGLVLVWLLAYGLFDVTILNERVLLYLMAIVAVTNMVIRNKELNINK